MDIRDNPPEFDDAPPSDALIPTFDVDVATVSVVDGMWLDQPDNVATFTESRLGESARGRGNLYICLDVSGEVEGRSEIERGLIEVIRDTFASGRGSISFALSEALRAANTYLYESNRQVARESRRMAGASVVVLRGNDLYIAQAGPAVVYIEASEKLARYPTESDWFVEDAPLIAPQGTASAPLGIRREFASDLAHASIFVGDVFVLATRALTQLASTQELAIAFTERSAQEIASHLEEVGEDADLTALIAELLDPLAPVLIEDALNAESHAQEVAEREPVQATPHIESLPVPLDSLVTLDESEPLREEEEEDEQELVWEEPAPTPAAAAIVEHELNWDDDVDDETEDETLDAPQSPHPFVPKVPQPVYAAAAAAVPMMQTPAFSTPAPVQSSREEWEAEAARRREERAARRTVQKETMSRAVGGMAGAFMMVVAAVGGVFSQAFGSVDWNGMGKQTNRFLNLGVGALITFFLLLVRLVLPGAAPRSTSLIPRRATSDPLWLKAMAIVLPVLFIGLALGRYAIEIGNANERFEALVAQADTLVKQAEVNPDKTEARDQLNDAMKIIRDAQTVRDSQKARSVLFRVQNQLDEIDGVALLYFLPEITTLGGAQLKQIAASDQDVFLLDGRGRVYDFIVNDASGKGEPAQEDGVLLKTGDKVGAETVEKIQLLTTATPAQNRASVVAVTDTSILDFDLESNQWRATPVEDADQWGELRAIASFGGNLYLLDAKNNQIYRYSPNATGYTTEGVNYFPANAEPLLNKAVDLAIDGDVWVLNDNGTVDRFRSGTSVAFELAALPTPLKNPVAIFTRPEVDSLYVADAGNQRIVEFDKNGTFVRQFKPIAERKDVFQNLQDFTVNETKRKVYFINQDAAYMANIPK